MHKSWFFLFFIVFISHTISSQRRLSQAWIDLSISKKFSKKLDVSLGMTNRIGDLGIQTNFSQFSVKYKLSDWIFSKSKKKTIKRDIIFYFLLSFLFIKNFLLKNFILNYLRFLY